MGCLRPFPPLFFSLGSFATAEAAKSFDRMRHLVGDQLSDSSTKQPAWCTVANEDHTGSRATRGLGPQSEGRSQEDN